MTNKISLTPEMAKRLGLNLKAGDDVAIMLKGKVSGVGDSTVVDVEDVRGKMADGAMVDEYGNKDHSKMARAFRLVERKREQLDAEGRGGTERANDTGEDADGQVSETGEGEREEEAS